MQELGFRSDYDGAQDYDLVLRAVGKLIYEEGKGRGAFVHIPKVLYHWRCHRASTAENPESKRYAYEAGKRALEDFLERRGWKGEVRHTLHLGFYHIAYENHIFTQRKEAGVIGGKLVDKRGRVAGGVYNARGKCPYLGLNRNFSGYMHRADLNQEAYAVDLRCIQVRKELWGIFEEKKVRINGRIRKILWKNRAGKRYGRRKRSFVNCAWSFAGGYAGQDIW